MNEKKILNVIILSSEGGKQEKIVIIEQDRERGEQRSSKSVYNTLYCVSIVYVTVKMGSQERMKYNDD